MDTNYTFEQFIKELEIGYQMYFTYVKNRYLLFKASQDCYMQKLISDDSKNPQPRNLMITYTRVKEMFPFMEEIEYKVNY